MHSLVFLLSPLVFILFLKDLTPLDTQTHFLYYFNKQQIHYNNDCTKIPTNVIEQELHINHMIPFKNQINHVFLGKDWKLNFRITGLPNINNDIKKALQLSTTFITLKNVYVNGKGSFGFNDSFMAFHDPPEIYYDTRSGFLVAECDNLIHTVSRLSRITYGHIFIDLWATLVLIPQKIREQSYVIGTKTPSYFNDALQNIGFLPSQIISTEEETWVYTQHFHTIINPRAYVIHFGITANLIYDHFVQTMNINKIVPKRFILTNKKKQYPRHFQNIEKFYEFLKEKYPHIPWECISDTEPTIKDTIFLYAATKLLFGASSSLTMKSIFMHQGTVIVAGLSDVIERGTFWIAIVREINLILFRMPGSSHFLMAPLTIDFNYALEGIARGLYILKLTNSLVDISNYTA